MEEKKGGGGGGVEGSYESPRHRTPSGGVMDAGREGGRRVGGVLGNKGRRGTERKREREGRGITLIL